MIFFYNIITLLLVPLLALFLPVYLLLNPEKRSIIPQRLGFGLKLPSNRKRSTIWMHALSVGEVTSACHLLKQLYLQKQPSTTIIFSTTTVSGHRLAQQQLGSFCDALIYYPLDFLPVVRYFHKIIQPDLFILIETDFWPNLLHRLASSDTNLLLFNGRVSQKSMARYQRFSFFFSPLFDTFLMLCMQTDGDARNMRRLGIAEEKVRTVGNLKFGGSNQPNRNITAERTLFPDNSIIIIAGSTHSGEEKTIVDSYRRLKRNVSQTLHLVIAPRKISRCDDVIQIIDDYNLTHRKFSSASGSDLADVTIIDTIGDLASLYRYADISFIGGSLVDEGGHNPLEGARYGCPLLFGPYMDDFSEIRKDLLECGGAVEVKDSASFYETLKLLVEDESKRTMIGKNAQSYIEEHQNVINDHLCLIDRYL